MISKEEFLKKVEYNLIPELKKNGANRQIVKKEAHKLFLGASVAFAVPVVFFVIGFILDNGVWPVCGFFSLFVMLYLVGSFVKTPQLDLLKNEKKILFKFCLRLFDLYPDTKKVIADLIQDSSLFYGRTSVEDEFEGKGNFAPFYAAEVCCKPDDESAKYAHVILTKSSYIQEAYGKGFDLKQMELKKSLYVDEDALKDAELKQKIAKVKEYFKPVTEGNKLPSVKACFFGENVLLVVWTDKNLFENYVHNKMECEIDDLKPYGSFYDTIEATLKTVELFER